MDAASAGGFVFNILLLTTFSVQKIDKILQTLNFNYLLDHENWFKSVTFAF